MPRIADRGPWDIIRAPIRRKHWHSLRRFPLVFRDPIRAMPRYLTTRGIYPWSVGLRTPLGAIRPTLYSYHDLRTVVEVFSRQDYGDGSDLRVVVDVGANIGLSVLYWLTQSPGAHVYGFEPDPRNFERLRANVGDFADRCTLVEAALTLETGPVEFHTEESGRYSQLAKVAGHTSLVVDGISIEDALAGVLERETRIDLLKIDTEGTEFELVDGIGPELRAHIRAIVYENNVDGVNWIR